MTYSKILLEESNPIVGLDVVSRVRSAFELRNGIFSTLERIKLENPNAKIFYKGYSETLTKIFLESHPEILPFSSANSETNFDLVVNLEKITPWENIRNVGKNIETDLSLLKDFKKWRQKFKLKTEKFSLVGKEKNLYVHPSVSILPGVVIDTSSGPVILDKNVKISPFSFLEGPLYIAPDASIDNARITGGTILGKMNRIGGEVENSIFQDFSNKHHEGFVGHSFVGSWVNFGALATTSDLKNNYGMVNLKIQNSVVNTGTIKFGSIVGDFSKISIGTMLNTGTVIDLGANVVQDRVSGYVPAFSWVNNVERYKIDRFLQDTKKIMARRNQTLSEAHEALLVELYHKLGK